MYESKTPEAIKSAILSGMEYGVDKREGSFASDMSAPVSLEMSKLYNALDTMLQMMFLDTIGGGYLDLRAGEYGLVRKEGTKAKCILTFSGVDETAIPAGTVVRTKSGLGFETLEACEITGGSAQAEAQAAEAGAGYNVAAGTVTELSLSGVNSVTNGAAAGGTDLETDDELAERLLYRLRYPATSGNVYHYNAWAVEVNGVGAAKILPLWNGNGTVKVVIVDGEKQPASGDVVSACAAHIETKRPIGATVTVVSAQGVTIDVSAAVQIQSTTTIQAVTQSFQTALQEYLQKIAFKSTTLLYNQVAYILLSVPGVTDYTQLQINNGTDNITLGETGTPVLGTVSINAAV